MENYVYELACALKDDFEVHVLAHSRSNANSDEIWDGFRVRRCATWFTALSQPFSPSLLTELARLWPDVVNLNAPNALANYAWALAARRSRLVITHHADVLGRAAAKSVYTPIYRRAVAKASKVIVFSKKNAGISVDLPPCEDKLVEIPFGLDPAAWEADAQMRGEAADFRSRLAGRAPVVSFVGRLIGYKGLDVLIEALAATPDVHAFVVGDGPLRVALEDSARGAGVADRFHLLGNLDDRSKQIAMFASDAFVLPSISVAEAFGISQVEAQFAGLPVIATNLPSGVTDVTVDGETGLLVQPGSAPDLAAALRRVLGDRELRARMGAAGRARAFAKFSRAVFRSSSLAVFRAVAEAQDL